MVYSQNIDPLNRGRPGLYLRGADISLVQTWTPNPPRGGGFPSDWLPSLLNLTEIN